LSKIIKNHQKSSKNHPKIIHSSFCGVELNERNNFNSAIVFTFKLTTYALFLKQQHKLNKKPLKITAKTKEFSGSKKKVS